MQTKLTLRLEDKLIENAKTFAKQSGKSVSQLVADYFGQLQQVNNSQQQKLPPITQQLSGILKNAAIENDKDAYHTHLENKYL